jgi:hypothetical protein
MLLTLLTVIVAGVLGGAIAIDLTLVMVLATVALTLFGLYNGLQMLARYWSYLARN